jgi:signal transduction histidine kinase
MDEQSSNLRETADRLQQLDQLTSRFLANFAAELRTWDSIFDQMKLETGGFELNIEKVDFQQLVERVTSAVSAYMKITYGAMEGHQDKIVRPKVKYIIPETLPTVKIDSLRIEHILTEILLAAVQISRSRKGRIMFSIAYDQSWLTIQINDNGVGLPKHWINRRPNLPSTSEAVVERHGGKLLVKNRARGGWMVNLKLPINVHQTEFGMAVMLE